MTALSPIKLTIDVECARTSVPAALEARLQNSPSKDKSPEALAEETIAKAARAEALRRVFIDAVKDRAARETQRAEEARARITRLHAAKSAKVQRKLDVASSHVNAVKEAAEEARQAKKAKRELFATNVIEARSNAAAAINARMAELKGRETTASANHAKAISTIVDKSHKENVQALTVVATQKEKEKVALEEASERLSAKLERAALTRSARLSKDASPLASPEKSKHVPLFRVKNEAKCASAMKGRSLEAAMDKAATNREALIAAKVASAKATTDKAKEVVAAQKAISNGTDADLLTAKHALYERLNNTEVARLTALQQRQGFKEPAKKHEAILIASGVAKPRDGPSAALRQRLAKTPTGLVDSAATRQEGAATRRAALRAAKALKLAAAKAKRAAVPGFFETAVAKRTSKYIMQQALATAGRALVAEQKQAKVTTAKAKAGAAAAKRAGAAASLELQKVAFAAKAGKATERVLATKSAKKGTAAKKAAAFLARRAALRAGVEAKGLKGLEKRTDAAARRAGFLAKRVATAKKAALLPLPTKDAEPVELTEASSEC